MIIMLQPDVADRETVVRTVMQVAERYPGIRPQAYDFIGSEHLFTEIHLVGPTASVPPAAFEVLAGVLRVVRVSTKYRLIGRHDPRAETVGFSYNGLQFDERTLHIFAGLCAVDSREHVDEMFAALGVHGILTARMGTYKPRTSPYDFQGLGKSCLPYVFELAGKHGIKVVAMEVTDGRQIEDIQEALAASGNSTGVMLQVGTRNAQNFELLKLIGQQKEFPVLFKRGMGISLEESLNACEYIASEGNSHIVFCLRGLKSHLGDPHRNLVDFAHVPVVRRQTRLLVGIDPSHSVGRTDIAPDGILDIFHATGQGILAGATLVLVEFHPHPEVALCDGPQALRLEQLSHLLEYSRCVRGTYENLVARATECGSQIGDR